MLREHHSLGNSLPEFIKSPVCVTIFERSLKFHFLSLLYSYLFVLTLDTILLIVFLG